MAAGTRRNRRPKLRSTCVVVAVKGANNGLTHLALLAITTQPPQHGRVALDIPDIERRRAGLSDLKRYWIVVDEYNYDVVERSWYIEPGSHVLGRFSKAFVMKIATAFATARQSGRRVDRLD